MASFWAAPVNPPSDYAGSRSRRYEKAGKQARHITSQSIEFRRRHVSRPGEGDAEIAFDPSRCGTHHQHTVCQQHGFLIRVRDEDGGHAGARPKFAIVPIPKRLVTLDRALCTALSTTLDILVKNVALWGTKGLCDLGIADGHFVSIGHDAASSIAVLTLDAEGRMAVPGFVEPHIHLDKALISECAPVNISGTLTEAIEILWNIKTT